MVIRKVSILLHTANAIFRPIKCKRCGLKNIIKLKHNEIIDRRPYDFQKLRKIRDCIYTNNVKHNPELT